MMSQGNTSNDISDSSRDELLRLLDAEIKHASEERSQAGWTQWAILGGMAGIAWLLLAQIENYPLRIEIIFLSSLYSIVLLESLKFLYKAGTRHQSDHDATIRFISTNLFKPSRARFAFESLGFFFLIYLTFEFPLSISLAQATFLKIFLWMVAIAEFGALIITFYNLPLPSKPRFAFAIHWLAITPLAAWAALSGIWGIANQIQDVLPEVRVGCLLVALYFLMLLLLGDGKGSPLIKSLIDIRRGLTLGFLSTDSAREQIDIALAGQRVAHTIQSDVTQILGVYGKAASDANEGLRIVEAFLNSLPKETPHSTEQLNIAKAVLDSCIGYMGKATNSLKSADVQSKKLGSRLQFLRRIEPNSAQEIEDLKNKLIETLQSNPPPLNLLKQRLDELRGILGTK